MARIRFWKGSSLLVAAAPLVAACMSGCADEAVPQSSNATGDGASELVAGGPDAQVRELGADGLPNFVAGDFGRLPAGADARARAATPDLSRVAPFFRLRPADLRLDRVKADELGFRHFKYVQQVGGEDVVGAEVTVHVDPSGLVYAAHGNARGAEPVPAAGLRQAAPGDLGADYAGAARSAPELVYVRSSRDGAVYRAWSIVAEGVRGQDPYKDRVFVDARTGRVVDVHPQYHAALNRKVYSGNNGSSLPGTLKRSEGQAPT
ncbi:MAG TPA: hypothetical protein VFS00_20155, partial [Polyangiaceae bacterium]|nr:hypothetical protein [Polyangiaceae bacterium]